MWDDKLHTGNKKVDQQHSELNELIVELGRMDSHDEDSAAIERMLYRILHYASVHFHDEEELMERIGYPGLERQKRLHSDFANKATRLASEYVVGPVRPSLASIQSFMRDWLLRHVLDEDLHMAEYIQERQNAAG